METQSCLGIKGSGLLAILKSYFLIRGKMNFKNYWESLTKGDLFKLQQGNQISFNIFYVKILNICDLGIALLKDQEKHPLWLSMRENK